MKFLVKALFIVGISGISVGFTCFILQLDNGSGLLLTLSPLFAFLPGCVCISKAIDEITQK